MRSRWLLTALLIVLAVALLALGGRALPAVAARAVLPTGGAQWVWEARGRNDVTPAAFYAVRDFELEAPPARARLLATADEEYVLHLNGQRVGSGAWTPGAGLDVYEVAPLLLPGGNRVVVELRSGRGAGGFLASLVDGESGEALLETDGAWRIVRQHHLGLVRGWSPLGGAEPAFCWGYPPIGRWGRPEPGREKPLFPALVERPVPPQGRNARKDGPRGAGLLFDWGREVTGYLVLDLPPRDERGTALLFAGAAPPDAWKEPPAGAVLVPPGSRRWMDARPRRFRYVLLLGMERPAAARVLPLSPRLDARTAAALLPREGVPEGVFGIAPPPLRTPVEDEVWSELQGLPGVAGRKDL